MRYLWLLACLGLMGMTSLAQTQERVSGKVLDVLTGSTLIVSVKGERLLVRLREADCPEDGQPFFKEALRFTREAVNGRFVFVNIEKREGETVIGEVQYIGNKVLSYELLTRGLAFYNWVDGRLEGYKNIAQTSRKEKIGLYVNDDPMPPWEYREQKVSASEGSGD